MLIDYEYRKKLKQLIVSYVDSDGDIKLKSFDMPNPVGFEECDDNDSK